MNARTQGLKRVADHFENHRVYQGRYSDRGLDAGIWERLDASIPLHEIELAAALGAIAKSSSVESYGVGPERFMSVTYVCSVANVADFFRQIGIEL